MRHLPTKWVQLRPELWKMSRKEVIKKLEKCLKSSPHWIFVLRSHFEDGIVMLFRKQFPLNVMIIVSCCLRDGNSKSRGRYRSLSYLAPWRDGNFQNLRTLYGLKIPYWVWFLWTILSFPFFFPGPTNIPAMQTYPKFVWTVLGLVTMWTGPPKTMHMGYAYSYILATKSDKE